MLWVVGRVTDVYTNSGKVSWDLEGIFDTEMRALNRCKNAWYFVAPVELNAQLPEGSTEWPGLYFPFRIGVLK